MEWLGPLYCSVKNLVAQPVGQIVTSGQDLWGVLGAKTGAVFLEADQCESLLIDVP